MAGTLTDHFYYKISFRWVYNMHDVEYERSRPGYRASSLMVCSFFLCITLSACANNASVTRYVEYQTKTDLRIPLSGVAYITNGGRSSSQNNHKDRTQRYAVDIVSLQSETAENEEATNPKSKRFYTGLRRNNESHYCFGRLVVAPGDGLIYSVKDRFDDNAEVGAKNNRAPLGNHIVINHKNDEYSVIAHLKKDTIRVKPQQRVKQGDPLGECGNSGRSIRPHVHYHLQTSPLPFHGDGLPIQFRNYYSDGQKIDRGEPIRGETVAHPDT